MFLLSFRRRLIESLRLERIFKWNRLRRRPEETSQGKWWSCQQVIRDITRVSLHHRSPRTTWLTHACKRSPCWWGRHGDAKWNHMHNFVLVCRVWMQIVNWGSLLLRDPFTRWRLRYPWRHRFPIQVERVFIAVGFLGGTAQAAKNDL